MIYFLDSLKASFRPYNHDTETLAPDGVGDMVSAKEDLDALVSAYNRISNLKDEMTTVIDLILKMRILEAQLAAAEEADKPAIQTQLDAVIADLST